MAITQIKTGIIGSCVIELIRISGLQASFFQLFASYLVRLHAWQAIYKRGGGWGANRICSFQVRFLATIQPSSQDFFLVYW